MKQTSSFCFWNEEDCDDGAGEANSREEPQAPVEFKSFHRRRKNLLKDENVFEVNVVSINVLNTLRTVNASTVTELIHIVQAKFLTCKKNNFKVIQNEDKVQFSSMKSKNFTMGSRRVVTRY